MIEILGVSKRFGDITALEEMNAEIAEGEIFGLVGTNGAGKSTLLRLMSGVLKPETGEIRIDGEPVYENPEAKRKICFIPDTSYFYPNATPLSMASDYALIYPEFDTVRYCDLLLKIGLEPKRNISTFSKGMKKQVSVLLGICANTPYLFCDETFDGLDPVMRQAVKTVFATELCDRKFTPVIASHNLRELEDICDHVGLLHKGRILLSENLEDMRLRVRKVQCVFDDPETEKDLLESLNVVRHEKQGSVLCFIAKGDPAEILANVHARDPVFAEALPLSLEEIFITETEVAGYDIRNLIS